jgi:phage terminase small subunit
MTRKRSTPEHLAKHFNLTMLEARFAWHHGAGTSGARAAREAGYSSTNAKRIAWAVNQKPKVKAALERVKLETHWPTRIAHFNATGETVKPLFDDSETLEQLIHRLANSSSSWRKNFRLAGIKYTREK